MSREQPNIVLIMADQLTPFMMGAYGNSWVKTPALDRLAADGLTFRAAYTSNPLCAPARASLMTGRYSSSIGAFDNATPFSSAEPTFAHLLTLLGYDTALTGKMHFVGPDQLHGFRSRLTTDIYPSSFAWTPTFIDESRHLMQEHGNAANYVAETAGVRNWSYGLRFDEETHLHAKEYLQDRAWRQDQTPFFLCVSYHHPHDPFHVPADLWDLYEGVDIPLPRYPEQMDSTYTVLDRWLNNGFHRTDKYNVRSEDALYAVRRAYAGLVTYIDRKVGDILRILSETGLERETIVVFASDHGDMLGERGMVQKRCFYEWSTRIPLLIRFPDGRHRGESVCEPVSLMDLGPTIVEWAGDSEYRGLPVDGRSLSDLMDGAPAGVGGGREVLCESHGEGIVWPCFMIRKGRFKYTYIHEREAQLFDLDSDPGEWRNLSGASEYAHVESDLRQRILTRFDPERIHSELKTSIAARHALREAMKRTGTRWDYLAQVDATRHYH